MTTAPMQTIARAEAEEQLEQISGWIHDHAFVVEGAASFDADTATLDIVFWLESLDPLRTSNRPWYSRLVTRIPLARSILRIGQVESWQMTEKDAPRTSELEGIYYDARSSTLRVDATVVVGIEAKVHAIDVEVLTSTKATGWRRSLFGGSLTCHGPGWLYIPGYSDPAPGRGHTPGGTEPDG